MKILAIDPGNIQSGFVIWDGKTPMQPTKATNGKILNFIKKCDCEHVVVEKIVSYMQRVGETTFETAFWSGCFAEATAGSGKISWRIPRKDVKLHLCGSCVGINDSSVTAALYDRFAPGQKNFGKGTKKEPGFFHGFSKDIWQAFALAVTWWDRKVGDGLSVDFDDMPF